jgi:hypothetical protein
VDKQAREKLAEFIRSEADLLQDGRRLRGLLEDACPAANREIEVLVAAVEENIPARIARSSSGLSVAGNLDHLAQGLVRERAMDPSAARWAVWSWAWALDKAPAPNDATTDPGDLKDPAAQAEMGPLSREKLAELLGTYGVDLSRDPRRVKGLLQDLVPGHRREQLVLVAAAEDGIPDRILSASGTLPAEGLVARLASEFAARHAFSASAALWAVQSWAWALGKSPEPLDGRPPEQASPPPPMPPPEPPRRGGGEQEQEPRYTSSPPTYETPEPRPRPTEEEPSPPPPRRWRRILLPALAGVAVVGGVITAVAIANTDDDPTFPPPVPTTVATPTEEPYTPPETPPPADPPTSDPPPVTNPALSEIEATFAVPSSACSDVTMDEPGVLGAVACLFDTDEAGNALAFPVFVRYAKWASQLQMDTFFDRDVNATGYEETTWFFTSSPDFTEGRLIEFEYDDGERGLDWTHASTLLSGEAKSPDTKEALNEWWQNIRKG